MKLLTSIKVDIRMHKYYMLLINWDIKYTLNVVGFVLFCFLRFFKLHYFFLRGGGIRTEKSNQTSSIKGQTKKKNYMLAYLLHQYESKLYIEVSTSLVTNYLNNAYNDTY